MGRKKVEYKNKPISISLPEQQIKFLNKHPKFNISKFVQLALDEQINLTLEVERIEKEVNLKREETII
jgi:hypothetical protein